MGGEGERRERSRGRVVGGIGKGEGEGEGGDWEEAGHRQEEPRHGLQGTQLVPAGTPLHFPAQRMMQEQ